MTTAYILWDGRYGIVYGDDCRWHEDERKARIFRTAMEAYDYDALHEVGGTVEPITVR